MLKNRYNIVKGISNKSKVKKNTALVVKLADTPPLGGGAERRRGANPLEGTNKVFKKKSEVVRISHNLHDWIAFQKLS